MSSIVLTCVSLNTFIYTVGCSGYFTCVEIVSESIYNSLCNCNSITNGAVLTFGKTVFCTGGSDCLINNLGVSERGCQNLAAYGTGLGVYAVSFITGCVAGSFYALRNAGKLVTAKSTVDNFIVRAGSGTGRSYVVFNLTRTLDMSYVCGNSEVRIFVNEVVITAYSTGCHNDVI